MMGLLLVGATKNTGATTKERHMKTKASDYFAMIPEWVLYGDISPAAVRVYGCLHRFANGQTAKCHPSRTTIAKLCRISVKSVDRALDELIKLGAVTCTKRWIDAEGEITEDPAQGVEFTSNEYTVIMTLPRVNLTPPLGKSDATGRDKNDTQTKAILNQSQEPSPSTNVEVVETPLVDLIAKQWWESRDKKPLGKKAWWTLRSVIQAALDRDYEPQEITDALNRYGTIPSLPALDRELQRIRPLSAREERMKEMFEYAQTRTHNPFDPPTQGELNP